MKPIYRQINQNEEIVQKVQCMLKTRLNLNLTIAEALATHKKLNIHIFSNRDVIADLLEDTQKNNLALTLKHGIYY